jgi:hypothetical protein
VAGRKSRLPRRDGIGPRVATTRTGWCKETSPGPRLFSRWSVLEGPSSSLDWRAFWRRAPPVRRSGGRRSRYRAGTVRRVPARKMRTAEKAIRAGSGFRGDRWPAFRGLRKAPARVGVMK